ncbi:hypothetical protein [Streptosporangium sp. KLBMP 9127]|nr:hypothetical protein [Streptosporangium sp. KLBMP 9127]
MPVTESPAAHLPAWGRSAILLLRPLLRAIDWPPAATVAVCTAAVALLAFPGRDLDPFTALTLTRMAGLLFGAASAFALVDAMSVSSGALPVPRWLRQWLRTLMVLVPVTAGWGLTYAIVLARLAPGASLPLAGTALEAAVCVLAALGGAAVAVRRSQGRQAALTGAAVLGALVVASLFLSGDLWPWPLPGDVSWEPVHRGWLAALPVVLTVLVVAHRDLRGRRSR